jgi:hypothetical protein
MNDSKLIDNNVPIAICKNITVQLATNGQVSITATNVNDGSSDDCSIASISVLPNVFNCSKTGENNVILTVTDASGNISTCTAVVTVKDDNNLCCSEPSAVCKT